MKNKRTPGALENCMTCAVYFVFAGLGALLAVFGVFVSFMDGNEYARFIGRVASKRYRGTITRPRETYGHLFNQILTEADRTFDQYMVAFLIVSAGVLLVYFMIRRFRKREHYAREWLSGLLKRR